MKTNKTDRVIFLILNLLFSKGLSTQEVFVFLGAPSRSQGYKILKELSAPNKIRPAVIDKKEKKYFISNDFLRFMRQAKNERS